MQKQTLIIKKQKELIINSISNKELGTAIKIARDINFKSDKKITNEIILVESRFKKLEKYRLLGLMDLKNLHLNSTKL